MAANSKREASGLFKLLSRRPKVLAARPCDPDQIDYKALCDDVAKRYPRVLKHLAE